MHSAAESALDSSFGSKSEFEFNSRNTEHGTRLRRPLEAPSLQPEPHDQQQARRAADNFHRLFIRRLHPDHDEEDAAERGDDGERTIEAAELPRAIARPRAAVREESSGDGQHVGNVEEDDARRRDCG